MRNLKLHDELISALHKFIKENNLISEKGFFNDRRLNFLRYKCEPLTLHYISIIFDVIYYQGSCYGNNYPPEIQNNWRDIVTNITIKYLIRLLKEQNLSTYRIIRCRSNLMPTYRGFLKYLNFDGKEYIGNNISMTYKELLTICDNIKKES